MQKVIITVTTDSLIKANALFQNAVERGVNAVNVTLTMPDNGPTVGYEGRRCTDTGAFVFTTYDESLALNVTTELSALGIEHEIENYSGRGLKINVLELLRTGWLVHAPKNQNTLRVKLPTDLTIELRYRNDGTSLYAEYDGIDTPATGETRCGVWSLLKLHLLEANVHFEVL